ncbi:hypothetical protein P0082_00555 [Candidatus Haliotispira prima]|uniref:Uncharacterized protein n=1 Tax=Candidatus Haliotispira prima TaxID=3034016 RepID=A0ABY8MH78_9SPIO|nr:hypothetical protein P0082_00555 [Candidatus Haliotispira prima]
MVSSVQLEMSSIVTIAKIGAVIRLAGEAAPSKAEAEANAGYVSLSIDADSTRKFSISQHYGSDFADGLTLADVLTANTQYKLYLFFETNAISLIEGATLTNGVAVLLFTTATLPPAGDGVWGRARTDEKFVAGLPEWHFDSDQRGVFVAYAQFTDDFTSVALTTRTADDTEKKQAGTARVGAILPNAGFLFNFSKLGGSHPGNYYYVISADETDKQIGKSYRLEFVDFSLILHVRAPLTRY